MKMNKYEQYRYDYEIKAKTMVNKIVYSNDFMLYFFSSFFCYHKKNHVKKQHKCV